MPNKQPSRPERISRPPLLTVLAGLIVLAGLAAFVTFTAVQNDHVFRANVSSMQRVWDERVANRALPDQEAARRDAQNDRASLTLLLEQFRGLYFLLTFSIASLAALVLLSFFGYRYMAVPLRKLEESCRDLLNENLEGHVWGIDRDDQFGSIARKISDIRNRTQRLSDMVLVGEDGEQHVRFEGRSAATFNTLIAELIEAVEELRARGTEIGTIAAAGQERLGTFVDITARQSHSLETAVDSARTQLSVVENEWSEKLSALFHQNNLVTSQSRNMAEQFRHDMETLKEISVATGRSVRETLTGLNASNVTLRAAADKSLEAGTSFSQQTGDITEKLVAATNLLRASGKVMSETSDAARTRLIEAVNSVSGHDLALRTFLNDTMEKTGRITTMFDTLSANTERAATTVERFDERMTQFEARSGPAFAIIEQSGTAISGVALQLDDAHGMMSGALDSMRSHSEALSSILSAIRNEYTSFTSNWTSAFADAAPAIQDLRDTSNNLRNELREEWASYAHQSRQLLGALEGDVRSMNARTETVVAGTERLINNLASQSQRIGDSANHFDLQMASMAHRMEAAAGVVVESNRTVISSTEQQIGNIHEAVSDMVQRLNILSQLTGTLGSVAGQLGQIVPALGDAARFGGAALTSIGTGGDGAVTERLERVATALNGSLRTMHVESETVRRQVSNWVEMLTAGYQKLSGEIARMDANIVSRITEFADRAPTRPNDPIPKPLPGPANGNADILPAIRLMHDGLTQGVALQENVVQQMHMLRGDLKSVGADIGQTVKSLKALEAKVTEGFSRIEISGGGASGPVEVQVDMSRVETASAVLESMLGTLQNHSQDLVGRLSGITLRMSALEEEMEDRALDSKKAG